jgi:hypothetical protein
MKLGEGKPTTIHELVWVVLVYATTWFHHVLRYVGRVLCGHFSLIEHLRLGGVWQLRFVSKFKHKTKHVFGI